MSKNQAERPFSLFGSIKGIAITLIGLFAVALIHAMVAKLAEKLGWDQFLIYLMGPPVGAFLSYLTGQPWFWLLAGLSVGVLLGIWTARFRANPKIGEENLRPNGTVSISNPLHLEPVQPGWVVFKGTHNLLGSRGNTSHLWLVTQAEEKYWPQTEISLHPDGRWQERISIGNMPGPRACIVLLVNVTDFTHDLFEDIKNRSRQANYHGPVVMKPPKEQFLVLQALVLQVPPSPESPNQQSERQSKSRIEVRNSRFVDNRHGKNRHYQIEVVNTSSSDINRCQAVLKQIDRNGQTVWGGQNAALTFQPEEDEDATGKIIRPGTEQFLDIVVLNFHPVSGLPTSTAAIAYQQWDTHYGTIEVRPCTKGRKWIFNETLEEIFAAHADHLLTLEIGAEGTPPTLVKLKFHYDGGNSTLEIIEQTVKHIPGS